MRIFLVGFMGSGKTTLGKPLATRLGYPFIDLDRFIEEKEDTTIPQIFATEGEAAFRLLEKKYLTEIIRDYKEVVVSTGGGSPCFHDNMRLMNENGLTVYLRIDPKMLADRLRSAKHQRPLVADKSEQELYDYITRTVTAREEHYGKANVIVANPSRDINHLVRILEPYFT